MSAPLISLENVTLAYGLSPLLDQVKLQVFRGERVCLIGRNGAGKSSLMKLIEGLEKPDAGSIWREPTLKIARLNQTLPVDIDLSVFEYVAEGLANIGRILTEYHQLLPALANPSDAQLKRFEVLQHDIEVADGWRFEQKIQTVLTRLELNADARVSELSGGWQRRAALARAWVLEPDLLLLDEPTNHLDIEAIQWLEEALLSFNGAMVFITHDRALLQKLATRIIELDRGQLTSWPCTYYQFLERKQAALEAETKANAEFDKKLAQEEVWIRQGIKARRTRNEGRVRALQRLREERRQRREQTGQVNLALNTVSTSSHLIFEAENLAYHIQDRVLIQGFNCRVMRGDRIGLIGPNGVGKSTLLQLLLGDLTPTSGKVKRGVNIDIAYFDQHRAALDLEKSVADNVTEGSDTIELAEGKRHIISYLGDFLFTPERARTPVKALSGGECNRLLLAKLFSKPSNLLILDEPTNDLDIDTLALLEELLMQYKGTILLVSHDREFLDNVVTSVFVFEGVGRVQEYVGGYADWKRYVASKPTAVEKVKVEVKPVETPRAKTTQKLSFKEQRELNELPVRIETLEAEIAALTEASNDPAFYQQTPQAVADALAKLAGLNAELEVAYKRWGELDL